MGLHNYDYKLGLSNTSLNKPFTFVNVWGFESYYKIAFYVLKKTVNLYDSKQQIFPLYLIEGGFFSLGGNAKLEGLIIRVLLWDCLFLYAEIFEIKTKIFFVTSLVPSIDCNK